MSDQNSLFQVLTCPRVTEKSTLCMERGNQVIFRVNTRANKPQIKAAVEKLFDVTVVSVQTMNVRGKVKRLGRNTGRRKDWKKAMVRLAEGQSIDFDAQS